MDWPLLLMALDSGLIGTLAKLAVAGAMILLILMLVALGGYGYKQLRGDGVEWPDEEEEAETVSRNDSDDEWKYS